MIYPNCLGHLVCVGRNAPWDDDTFSFHQLQREPGKGGLH